MEIKTQLCTIDQFHRYHDLNQWYSNFFAISTPIDDPSVEEYNRYDGSMITFTTPDFVGSSEYISCSFYTTGHSGDSSNRLFTYGTMDYYPIEYALCSSNENMDMYIDAVGVVEDEHKLTGGTITTLKDNDTRWEFVFETDKLKSNTTYYLYLWSAVFNKTSKNWSVAFTNQKNPDYNSITIGYIEGSVHISNGDELEAYQVCIDNGSSWDMYLPYIDNGSSWEICV